MNIGRTLAISFMVLALCAEGNSAAWSADSADDPNANPQVLNGQPQAPANSGGVAHGALEISPQASTPPPVAPPAPPADNANPDTDATTSYEQYQGAMAKPPAPPPKSPYLGFVVEDTLKNYEGQEVHGLEVVTIDADGPAQRAGLKGRGDVTPIGAAGVTAGALLGPLSMAVIPLLHKSGQLGKDGDLIIAVDDRRVHGEFDFRDELGKLKPGDTIYLTVIRATEQGGHQTLKIPVKIGAQTSEEAIAAPAFDPYSMQSPY
jgi:hypothetical protein